MSKRILDSDGVVTDIWHHDEGTDTTVIERRMDAQPIIDLNRYKQDNESGYTPSREMRHVAKIDLPTYERWLREAFGDNFMQRPAKDRMAVLKRKINDPDFRHYRTISGRA